MAARTQYAILRDPDPTPPSFFQSETKVYRLAVSLIALGLVLGCVTTALALYQHFTSSPLSLDYLIGGDTVAFCALLLGIVLYRKHTKTQYLQDPEYRARQTALFYQALDRDGYDYFQLSFPPELRPALVGPSELRAHFLKKLEKEPLHEALKGNWKLFTEGIVKGVDIYEKLTTEMIRLFKERGGMQFTYYYYECFFKIEGFFTQATPALQATMKDAVLWQFSRPGYREDLCYLSIPIIKKNLYLFTGEVKDFLDKVLRDYKKTQSAQPPQGLWKELNQRWKDFQFLKRLSQLEETIFKKNES